MTPLTIIYFFPCCREIIQGKCDFAKFLSSMFNTTYMEMCELEKLFFFLLKNHQCHLPLTPAKSVIPFNSCICLCVCVCVRARCVLGCPSSIGPILQNIPHGGQGGSAETHIHTNIGTLLAWHAKIDRGRAEARLQGSIQLISPLSRFLTEF